MKRLPLPARDQLKKARESALLAVEIYNKPAAAFKSGGYIVLMVIAWTALFHAIFFKRRLRPYYRDPQHRGRYQLLPSGFKFWELDECLRQYYLADTENALRKNLEMFIGLRNHIEHRFMPALDAEIFGECQAMLLNFDKVIEPEFGPELCIRESLSFALQMFPSTNTLARSIAKDGHNRSVAEFITRYRASIGSETRNSEQFAFRAFLVQVAGHPNSQTLAIQFIRAQDLTPEQQQSIENLTTVLVKNKRVSVHNADLLRPSEVIKKVQAGLGNPTRISGKRLVHWFTINSHSAAVRLHKVHPPKGDPHPELTRSDYCIYDEPHRDYLYTQPWVDLLIKEQAALIPKNVSS